MYKLEIQGSRLIILNIHSGSDKIIANFYCKTYHEQSYLNKTLKDVLLDMDNFFVNEREAITKWQSIKQHFPTPMMENLNINAIVSACDSEDDCRSVRSDSSNEAVCISHASDDLRISSSSSLYRP